jgi:flavin-dependent dehydrogenase
LLSTSAPGAKFKVAVVGGGPSGSCAAEILAKNPKIECVLIERKMNNAKPCGGAIPLCMMDEFALPMELVDRKVFAHSFFTNDYTYRNPVLHVPSLMVFRSVR